MKSHFNFNGTEHEMGNFSQWKHRSAEQPDYYSNVDHKVRSLAREELISPDDQQYKEAIARARAQQGLQHRSSSTTTSSLTSSSNNNKKGGMDTNVDEPAMYGPSALGGGSWKTEAARYAVDAATELHRLALPWVGQGKDEASHSHGRKPTTTDDVRNLMERSTGDTTDKEIKKILAISKMEEDEAYNKQASKWKFWKDPSKDSRLNRARRMGLLPRRGGGTGDAAAAGGRWGTMGYVVGSDGTTMGLSELLTSSPLQTLSQNMSTHYRAIVKKEESRLERMPKIAQVLLAPLYPNATLYNHVIKPILSPTLGTYFIASMASNDNRFNSESVLFAFPEVLGTQPLFGALDEEESARRDQAQRMVRCNRLLVIAATSAIGFGGAHGSGTPPILPAFATPSTAFQTLLNTTSTPEGVKSSSWTFKTLQRYRSFCALSSILSHPSIVTTRDLALLQRIIWNRVCELESTSIRQNHLRRTAAAALQQQQQGGDGNHTQMVESISNEPPASLIKALGGVLSAVDRHLINHGLPFPSFGRFIDESWNGAIRGEFLDRLQWVKPFLAKWRDLEARAQYFVKTQTTDMSVARALHSQYGGEEGVDTTELDERELEIIHLYGYQYFNGIRYGTAAFCMMALYVRFMSRRRDRGTWVMERCRRELELAIDAAEAATRSGKVQPSGKLFESLCAGRRLLEARHIQRRDLIANLQGANMADGHTKGLSFFKKVLIRGIPKYGVDTITHPLDWRLVPPPSSSIGAMLLGTSTNTSKLFLSNAANNTAPLQLASPLPMLCEPVDLVADDSVDYNDPSSSLLSNGSDRGKVRGGAASLAPFDGVALASTTSSHQLLYLRGTPVERSVAFYTANRDPEMVALRKRTIIDHAQRLHQQLIIALTQTCPTPEDVQVIPISSGGQVGGGIDRKLRAHVVDHNDVTFASDVRLIEQHLKELEEEDDLQGEPSSSIDSQLHDGERMAQGGEFGVEGDKRKHPLAHAAVVSALKKRPLLSENLARISGNNQDESATFACYQHIQSFDSSFRPPFPDAASKGKSEEVAAVLRELYKPDPKLGQYSLSRRVLHYIASLIAGETTLETASERAKPIRKNTPHKTNVIDRLQPGLMSVPRHPIQSIKILFRTPLTHFNTTSNDGTRKLAVEHSRFESQGLFSFIPFQREKRDAALVGASGDAKDPATVAKARAAWNVTDVNSIKAFPIRLIRAISQRSTRPFHVPIAESGPKRSSTDEEIETFALEDDFYSKAKQRRAQQLEKRAQRRRELDDAAASTAASATQYIEVETNNFVADDESPQPHQLAESSASSSTVVTAKGEGGGREVALRAPEPLSMYHPFPGPPTLLDAATIQSLRRYYGVRRLSLKEFRNYWRLQVEVSRFGPNMLTRDIDALYRGAAAATTNRKSNDDDKKNNKEQQGEGETFRIPFSTRVYLWAKYPPFSLIIAFIIIPTLIAVQMCRWYLAHLRCREIQADEDDLFNLQREAHLLQQVYGEQEEEMDSVEKEFSFGEANDATYGTAHLPFSLVDRVRMLVGGPSSPLSQALAHDPTVGVSGYTPSPALWWLAATSDSTLQHRSASRAATTTTSPGLKEVVEMIGREQRRELQWGLSQIWSTRQRIVEGADQPDYFTSKEYFDVVLLGRVPQYHLSTVIGANLGDSPQSKKRKESNRKQLQQLTIMTSTEMLVLRKDQQVELIRRSMKEGIEDSKRAAAAETGGSVQGGSGTELDGRIPGADMVIHRPTGRILPSAEVSGEQWATDPYVYFEAGFAEGAITSLIGTLRDVYLPDPAPRWVPIF